MKIFHKSEDGAYRECTASIRVCPFKEHIDFYDETSATVANIAQNLLEKIPSDSLASLIEKGKSGQRLSYEDISAAMKPHSILRKNSIGRIPVKKLASVLYSMGRTFDNLDTNALSTEDFLRTGNPLVVKNKSSLELLEDLNASAKIAASVEPGQIIDLKFLQDLNGQIFRTASITPGVFRTTEPISVRTRLGLYDPKPVDKKFLSDTLADAQAHMATKSEAVRSACKLFVVLAKAQPFTDGNKRTAMLTAEACLISKFGDDVLISVPADDVDKVNEFNSRLSKWYVNDDDGVVEWLARWNEENGPTPDSSSRS